MRGENPFVLSLSKGAQEPTRSSRPLRARDLGLIGYSAAWSLQERLAAARAAGAAPDTLLLLEHPPVVTLGRRGSMADVYRSEHELRRLGIELVRSTRGGLVTYHGPGQVVGYLIVSLRELGLRIPEYVHALERAVIVTLGTFGVETWSRADHVGVWTSGGKIASIGIAQRHGVTQHGLAVNVQPDLAHFQLLNPCGVGDLGVTSAAELIGGPLDVADFKAELAARVARELGFNEVDWRPSSDTIA